jgi:hypothetical protein
LGGISRHMDVCAAIAEIESGENVENSLLDAPDGQPHVQPTVVVFKQDPWADLSRKQGCGEGDKGTKEREGGSKTEEGGKDREEGKGQIGEDSGTDDDSVGAASPDTLSASEAMAALMSLNAAQGVRGEDRLMARNTGKRPS